MSNLPLPLVSVVIPCHNKSSTIKRAIDSIKAQSLNNLSCIVIDDSSPDNSKDIILAETANDRRFRYERVEFGNVSPTRNYGISLSDTPFICTLDGDDWIEPTFLEVCTKALMEDRSLGIAYTGLRWHNADGTSGISEWPGKFNPDKQLSYPKQNQIPTCNVFRKDAWERVGGYKARYSPNSAGSEDAALWSAICSIGYNARLITADYSQQIQRIESEIDTFKRAISNNDAGLDLEALKAGLNAKRSELNAIQETHNKPLVLFNYSAEGGNVHGNREYVEVDWLSMQPWAKDGQHPFASVATPKRWSHPVRQYDSPAISVIIPVGPGHEKEVMNALDSLEMQHFRKWEAVVVNDTGNFLKGDTPERIQYHQTMKAYPYVRSVTTGGKSGAGVARNLGAKVARAPLLFFLDADDVLADPHALDKMLTAWNTHEAIIYSDYLGKAVWDYEQAAKEFGDKLLHYHPKTQTAVFRKQAADFDCALAQKQPELSSNPTMPYYHWCLVSVLVPKAWHNQIGGFDESMATWEDVDYMWRLARAGHCFERVAEPLVMYSYHKGYRREKSAVTDEMSFQNHKSMIQYIKHKNEGTKPVGCGCGAKRQQQAAVVGEASIAGINDQEFVMIEFDFPGSETRESYGKSLKSITGQKDAGAKVLDYKGYGRGKGDRFLVHVKDQQARPDMFKLIPNEIKAPEVETRPLQEPVLIVSEPRQRKRAKIAA